MKIFTITLKNTFHDRRTTAKVINGRLTESQMGRIRRELCGVNDCRCFMRHTDITSNDHQFFLSPNFDGSCDIIQDWG